MKVVFITPVTPYKDNLGGPSGHPYHLMIERPKDIDIIIYSFNNNHLSTEMIHDVEEKLNVEIRLLKQPKWLTWLLKFHLTFFRLLLKYPINYYIRVDKKSKAEIENLNPDFIWSYCQEFNGLLKKFKHYKRVHSLPDCYSLHFYRRLGRRMTLINKKEFWRVLINYRKHLRMERDYDDSDNIVYHLVGKDDRDFLQEINPKLNAHFVMHPRYDIGAQGANKKLKFHQPKIKLLIAGRYDFYMQQAADEFIAELCKAKHLADKFEFTFLGKGWESHAQSMKSAGWQVQHIIFAPDYQEELMKHDIQITPISIGTGTKGKVLDAIANGLLVIGTSYALENVAVKDGVSCICSDIAERLPDILADIAAQPGKYELMAEAGRNAVLSEHGREKVAKEFFGLFDKP